MELSDKELEILLYENETKSTDEIEEMEDELYDEVECADENEKSETLKRVEELLKLYKGKDKVPYSEIDFIRHTLIVSGEWRKKEK